MVWGITIAFNGYHTQLEWVMKGDLPWMGVIAHGMGMPQRQNTCHWGPRTDASSSRRHVVETTHPSLSVWSLGQHDPMSLVSGDADQGSTKEEVHCETTAILAHTQTIECLMGVVRSLLMVFAPQFGLLLSHIHQNLPSLPAIYGHAHPSCCCLDSLIHRHGNRH
jgi:hypothetical protein